MDRQQVIGFALIFLVLVVWMLMNSPGTKQQSPQRTPPQTHLVDTVKQQPTKTKEQAEKTKQTPEEQYGKFFKARSSGIEKTVEIETDLVIARITSKGGLLKSWELKKFKTWDGHPVQLVNNDTTGDYSLLFVSSDGKKITTRDLYFDLPANTPEKIQLEAGQEYTLTLTLPSSNGGNLVKSFVFKNDEYGFNTSFQFTNLAEVVSFGYQVVWEGGLRYAEHNSIDESNFAAAYAYTGKELTEIDAKDFTDEHKKELAGSVDWVATRSKYFAVAIIPEPGKSEGAYLEGVRHHLGESGARESYTVSLSMPLKAEQQETQKFRTFLGPVDIGLLRSYNVGLENIMSLGWAWIVRPIAEYVMLPTISVLHYVIPNWGLVIIVFTILVKIALHPLTRTSMRSMKRMQALQPMMDEIKEKHKDDPQKMNAAVMNLYRDYGVNPAGGCLPVLLQFPILIALYNVFRGAIELRQASFFWWIKDLSVPDIIASLPFTIPIFGVKEVSGLALLMGITMFVQQKMSVKDPRQKAMVWIMPIVFTLLFNSFPSGLNLYYFIFNVLSVGQQMYINKQHDEEPLRKVDQKKNRGGIFGKLNLPKLPK